MSKIQVIALNDDNNSKSYVTRDALYYDAADFMKKCLLGPHDNEYEIREVYICGPQGALANIDEDEFVDLFDLLYLTYDPTNLAETNYEKWEKREAAFNLFWDNGEYWKYA